MILPFQRHRKPHFGGVLRAESSEPGSTLGPAAQQPGWAQRSRKAPFFCLKNFKLNPLNSLPLALLVTWA